MAGPGQGLLRLGLRTLQPALQHSQMSTPAHENKLSITMLGQLCFVAELCCFQSSYGTQHAVVMPGDPQS